MIILQKCKDIAPFKKCSCLHQRNYNITVISQRRANFLSLLRFVIWYLTIDTITLKMAEEYKPLIVGQDYSRLLKCIKDLRSLILPVVESHEARQAEILPVVESQEVRQAGILPLASLRRSDRPRGREPDSP